MMFKMKNWDFNAVVLVFLWLTLNIFHTCSSASIVDFEKLNAGLLLLNKVNPILFKPRTDFFMQHQIEGSSNALLQIYTNLH